MQQDFSDQSFVYSGQKYTLSFTLYVNSAKHLATHSLNNQCVMSFEYVNAFNSLCLYGSLTYVDRYGIVDKYFEKQFPYLGVMFAENEHEIEDENSEIEHISPSNVFQHDFFVTKVEILDRKNVEIKYKLHLMSTNWFKLASIISYSNYGRRPETILDLIKTAFALSKCTIDKDTFGRVKTNVKLNYITHDNENALSMVKSLLSKLYYYESKDTSLKMIYYNDIKDRYHVFDINDKQTSNATQSLVISLFNSQNETYLQQEPMNLASVAKFPKTQTFGNIFNYHVVDYDFQHNAFVSKPIKSEDIIAYQNARFSDDNFEDKFEPIFNTTLDYTKSGTYWNNDNIKDIYSNAVNILLEDNSLVLDRSGNILSKPGDFVNLNVDRTLKFVEDESPESLDDVKNKYKAFEGLWIVGKVHHIVIPAEGRYRQNLVLFRNFITADTNMSAT